MTRSASLPPIHRLYEDNHLLVVVKPPGIPVQSDAPASQASQASQASDLLTRLKDERKSLENKPGRAFVGLVHRLDQPVGGVMVFAKTSKAASRLSDQIRRHVWAKHYLAVVWGRPPEEKGTLLDLLWKDEATNTVSVVPLGKPGAKEAILHYRCLETISEGEEISLLHIRLETGRPHQIRVQFASRGHALVGDRRYGMPPHPAFDIALWSRRIELVHPTRSGVACFDARPYPFPPWSWFQASQASLGGETTLDGEITLWAGDED